MANFINLVGDQVLARRIKDLKIIIIFLEKTHPNGDVEISDYRRYKSISVVKLANL
jgi:hypothetical protein